MPTDSAPPPWQQQLQTAETCFDQGDHDQAEQAYHAVLESIPGHARAHSRLAWFARRRGDLALAFSHAAAALQATPNDRWRQLDLAGDLLALGRIDKAEAQYRAVLESGADPLRAHRGLATCARQRGDLPLAVTHYQAVAALAPEDVWRQLDLADVLRDVGRLDEAAAQYHRVLTMTSDSLPAQAKAHGGLGQCARRRGDLAAALPHFRAALALAPEDHWRRLELADTARDSGELDEAEALYHGVLGAAPATTARAHAGLGHCARRRGEHPDSLTHFEAAIALAPHDIWRQLDAADTLRQLGRLEEAALRYGAVVRAAPDTVKAHTGLGFCARLRGDKAAALGHFQAAMALAPTDIWRLLELADTLRELGRLDEAEPLYQQVTALAPDHFPGPLGTARCLRQRQGRAAAAALLEAALAKFPEATPVRLELAADQRELGQLAAAEANYRAVVAAAPDQHGAWSGLAATVRLREGVAAARQVLEEGVAASPGSIWIRLDLARQHQEAGEVAAARQAVQAVLAGHAHDAAVWLTLAQIERAAGDHEAALAAFTAARERAPGQGSILVDIAIESRQLGDQARCDDYLAAALALDPPPPQAFFTAGQQHLTKDEIDEAHELFLRGAAHHPSDTNIQLAIADILAAKGELDAALAHLDALEASQGPQPNFAAKRIALLRNAGLLHEALRRAQAGAQAFPQNFWLWDERFQCALLAGTDQEVEHCLAMMPVASRRDEAKRTRFAGLYAERRYRLGEAVAHFEAAAALNPEDWNTQHDLLRINLARFDLAAAERYLRRSCALNAPNTRLRGKSLNVSQTHYGQIFDDYRLDAATAAALGDARAQEGAARIGKMAAIAADNPSHIGAAVCLLVALREAGALDGVTPAPGETIPKTIMQFWNSADIPAEIATIMESWRAANPDCTIQRFDEAGAHEFLARHFVPPVRQAFARLQDPAQKADIFRLAFLAIHGGIYADADDRCLLPIRALLPEGCGLVLYQEDLGTIGNNFMAAMPRHPVVLQALAAAVTAVNRGDSDIVWLATGPGLITTAFTRHLLATTKGNGLPPGCVVHRLREATAVIGMHCKTGYKKSNQYWVNAAFARGGRGAKAGGAAAVAAVARAS